MGVARKAKQSLARVDGCLVVCRAEDLKKYQDDG